MPPKCGKRTDIFGDVKWDFEYARDQDDESSEENNSSDNSDNSEDSDHGSFFGQKRSPIDDYEVFLYGFYYYFVLQDPMINQAINEPNECMAKLSWNIVQDLHLFNKSYLSQWV